VKKSNQILSFALFVIITLGTVVALFLTGLIPIPKNVKDIALWSIFGVLFVAMINEGLIWIKNGKRSELSDLVMLAFLFIIVYIGTDDLFNAFLGSFSIYLLFGISELKDYEVLNKILYISVITYNIIFFTAILDEALGKDGVWRDTMFSLSFWIMLILGFIFFGRRYIVVWRFMSPQYLTLGLYLISWIAVSTVSDITGDKSIMDYIYEVLIVSNLIIYAFTGPLIDLMLGMKPTKNDDLHEIVNEVAPKIGLDPNKIKVRFGEYPILNAMAYGAFWDKRMAIIAPDVNDIPRDELKGIVAHELAHLKGKHTLSLTLISVGELYVRKILDWPATYYDYTFDPENQPFPLFAFILINLLIYFFLYIFVRMFEARADLNTKKAGYGDHLAKGLYNLESFYSSGREIGLNTMLLCDEKITKDNRIINYTETAQYMNKMMVSPKKGALISNFMNSHPPSYHRIIASLNKKDVSIAKESVMPLKFLKKTNAHDWFLETDAARKNFLDICNKKVKDEFGIENLRKLNEKLNPKHHYKDYFGKKFVFLNIKTYERFIGEIVNISYTDEVCEPVYYKIKQFNPETGNIETKDNAKIKIINPVLYDMVPFTLNGHYDFPKEDGILLLENINLESLWTEKKEEKKIKEFNPYKRETYRGLFKFRRLNLEGNEESKEKEKVANDKEKNKNYHLKMPIFKTKIPKPFEDLSKYKGNEVFIKEKGSYSPFILSAYKISGDFNNISFDLIPIEKKVNKNKEKYQESLTIRKENYVLRFSKPFIPIHNDEKTQENESLLYHYIMRKEIPIFVFLKKPVNNELEGVITHIQYEDSSKSSETEQIKSLLIHTKFDKDELILSEDIDFIYLPMETIVFQNKKNISGATNIIHKIIARLKPSTIMQLIEN